jgi:hypothetical protein
LSDVDCCLDQRARRAIRARLTGAAHKRHCGDPNGGSIDQIRGGQPAKTWQNGDRPVIRQCFACDKPTRQRNEPIIKASDRSKTGP